MSVVNLHHVVPTDIGIYKDTFAKSLVKKTCASFFKRLQTMPIQAPSWTDFLSCPICYNEFAVTHRLPISLGCGHTICRVCLATLHNRQCPFDQTTITTDVVNLPINSALLQLVSNGTGSSSSSNAGSSAQGSNSSGRNSALGATGGNAQDSLLTQTPPSVRKLSPDDLKSYNLAKECIENLALHLRSFVSNFGSPLSRPMQRKLVTLVNCQLMEEEGRVRALRAARSLGERTVTELILQHQNPQQLSSNLWASVRSRGCQFLGPAMQEQVLNLVLLALKEGKALSRKVLVMFVVQRLESNFPQASKTSIGHVVQLLYRASCFKVSKREGDSSLMQLKEEFRTYETLRREHDAQIVQIATEAGLRIAPDQWSSLLYGDTAHKSHMQSIIDKLQTPSSFAQSIQELVIALQRTGDPANLEGLRTHLKDLASIDPSLENAAPTWEELSKALDAVRQVVVGLVEFMQQHGNRKIPDCAGGQGCNPNTKYKISLCRDLTLRRTCPRGTSCTFAHSEEELERYRAKSRKSTKASVGSSGLGSGGVSHTPPSKKEGFQAHHAHHSTHAVSALLHPSDETLSTAIAVTPSPMRYSASAGHKTPRTVAVSNSGVSAFTDSVTSVHGLGSIPQTASGHHMRSLHQSPISPTNGSLLANSNSVAATPQTIAVPTSVGQHRIDPSSYGQVNYVSSPPRMQPLGQNTRNSNVAAGVYSSMNFPVVQLQISALAQPPQPQQSNPNSMSSSDVICSKAIYNFYEVSKMNQTSKFFNNSVNNTSIADFIPYGGTKSRQQVNSLWEHQQPLPQQQPQQHIQQQQSVNNINGLDLVNSTFGHNTNPGYEPSDTSSVSFFTKKSSSIILDQNGQSNATINSTNSSDTFGYRNAFSNSNNSSSGTSSVTSSGNGNGNSSGSATNSSSSGVTLGYSYPSNSGMISHETMLTNGIANGLQVNPHVFWDSRTNSKRINFREQERDSFEQTDPLLHDESMGSFEPASSVRALGPICSTFKDFNSTPTTISLGQDYLDAWNMTSVQSNKTVTPDISAIGSGHHLQNDTHYPIFSNGLDSKFRLNPQCDSNSPLPLPMKPTSVDSVLNSDTSIYPNFGVFSTYAAVADDKIDNNDSGFSLNGLHIGDNVDDNSQIKKNCSVSDVVGASTIWGDTGLKSIKSKYNDLDAADFFWSGRTMLNALSKDHQVQQQKPQQQLVQQKNQQQEQQQMLQQQMQQQQMQHQNQSQSQQGNNANDNSSSSLDPVCGFGTELQNLVKNVWSAADGNGRKLE